MSRLAGWLGHYCMVFEKLGMSLYDFLKEHDFRGYPIHYVREFARQLLKVKRVGV